MFLSKIWYIISTSINKEALAVKRKSDFLTLIMVVASIAAITAIIVTNIEKICAFFEMLRKKAEEACPFCCNDEDEIPVTESDFEDIEL